MKPQPCHLALKLLDADDALPVEEVLREIGRLQEDAAKLYEHRSVDAKAALHRRAQRAESETARVRREAIGQRKRVDWWRGMFLRVADAVGLVSTDDTGRIGDVAPPDEVLRVVEDLYAEHLSRIEIHPAFARQNEEENSNG